MVRLAFPKEEMLRMGLKSMGFSVQRQNRTCHQTNKERFERDFANLDGLAVAWVELQNLNIGDAYISKPNPLYFLMTVHWLKTYKKETSLAGMFNLDEKTVRKWLWKYAKSIEALAMHKVCTAANSALYLLLASH